MKQTFQHTILYTFNVATIFFQAHAYIRSTTVLHDYDNDNDISLLYTILVQQRV